MFAILAISKAIILPVFRHLFLQQPLLWNDTLAAKFFQKFSCFVYLYDISAVKQLPLHCSTPQFANKTAGFFQTNALRRLFFAQYVQKIHVTRSTTSLQNCQHCERVPCRRAKTAFLFRRRQAPKQKSILRRCLSTWKATMRPQCRRQPRPALPTVLVATAPLRQPRKPRH